MITRRKALGMTAMAPFFAKPLSVLALEQNQPLKLSLSIADRHCRIAGEAELKRALANSDSIQVTFSTEGADVFAVRISGGELCIVGADGSAVKPVTVNEFLIGGSETYDAIVSSSTMNSFAISVQAVNEVASAHSDRSHKVLQYADLKSPTSQLAPTPGRELVITTGSSMREHIWMYSGQDYTEQGGKLTFDEDEQIRVTLKNDTTIAHPINFGGLPFQIAGLDFAAAKHTMILMPGETISLDLRAPDILTQKTHALTNERTRFTKAIRVRPCYQHHPLLQT